jgi:hypothetical protein
MGLYTQTVKGLHRAPYRDQVISHLIRMGEGTTQLSPTEEAKIQRVRRFLAASDCAQEIVAARAKASPRTIAM